MFILPPSPVTSQPLVCANVTLMSSVQPEKALTPIYVTLSGIVISVSPVQPEKISYPMYVKLSESVIFVSPVQPEKAPFSILVTLSGIVFALRQPGTTGESLTSDARHAVANRNLRPTATTGERILSRYSS